MGVEEPRPALKDISPVGDVRFEAVGVTDIGRQRKHNEDHVLLRPELDLFVVADGMGGHNAGDVASRLATASLKNFYEATLEGVPESQRVGDNYGELSVDAQRLTSAVRKANRDVFEISSTYRQHHGMGSTVVAAYLVRNRGMMHVAHVGDSRCYRFREGKLVQLTHDHSLINDALALKPDLTPEELARLPKNIITRALGMREDVKVDVHSTAVQVGDVFLLCSDGLSGMVDDIEMASVLALGGPQAAGSDGDLRDVCETLVHLANENGGTDNITALLVRIDGIVPLGADTSDKIAQAEPAKSDSKSDTKSDTKSGTDAPEVETGTNLRLNTQELDALALEESGEGPSSLCPECGARVASDNVFCTQCGADMVVPAGKPEDGDKASARGR